MSSKPRPKRTGARSSGSSRLDKRRPRDAKAATGRRSSGRHKTKSFCVTCKEAISEHKYISSGTLKFHSHHFVCSVCKVDLRNADDAKIRDNRLYCGKHFEERFCPKCFACKQPIKDDFVQALGHHYHVDHFVCHTCGCTFDDKFYEFEGHPYCAKHHQERRVYSCTICKANVSAAEAMKLDNDQFCHPSCLKCHHCDKVMNNDDDATTFHNKDGKWFCAKDYSLLYRQRCAACSRPIKGSVLTIEKQHFRHGPLHFHPACMKCEVCHTKVNYFLWVQGTLRCELHKSSSLALPACGACSRPVKDPVPACGKLYHPDCLRCSMCETHLTHDSTRISRRKQTVCLPCLEGTGRGAMARRRRAAQLDQTPKPGPVSTPVPSKPQNRVLRPRADSPEEPTSSPARRMQVQVNGPDVMRPLANRPRPPALDHNDHSNLPLSVVEEETSPNSAPDSLKAWEQKYIEDQLNEERRSSTGAPRSLDDSDLAEIEARNAHRQSLPRSLDSSMCEIEAWEAEVALMQKAAEEQNQAEGEALALEAGVSVPLSERVDVSNAVDCRPDKPLQVPQIDNNAIASREELRNARRRRPANSENVPPASAMMTDVKSAHGVVGHRGSHNNSSLSSIDLSGLSSGLKLLYTKGKRLGAGAFGAVYRALDISDPNNVRQIAVKEIPLDEEETKNVDRLEEFIREVKLMRDLQHENIIQYLDVEIRDERICILMELANGSLNSLISNFNGSLSEAVIRVYARQILQGLNYLHRNKIIHRDIKSANILIGLDNNIKLADFGTSRSYDSILENRLTTMTGTPYFMAPEVIDVDPNKGYNLKADIWSVGCVIVEMITGKRPYPHCNNQFSAIYQIMMGKAPPYPADDISPELDDFLKRCFRKEPDQRPDTSELLSHPFLQTQPVQQ